MLETGKFKLDSKHQSSNILTDAFLNTALRDDIEKLKKGFDESKPPSKTNLPKSDDDLITSNRENVCMV